MGVTAQHEIEASMRGMTIGLRGMGEKNRDRSARDVLCRAMKIFHAVEMGIVDAG